MSPLVWVLVILILGAAYPIAQAVKHPEQRPIAAWLLLVSVFALVAAAIFLVVFAFANAAGFASALYEPGGAAIAAVVILVPAALLAVYMIRRPPSRRMPR